MLLAPHRQVRRSHRSIHGHAARRSALPRERFSPLTDIGHLAVGQPFLRQGFPLRMTRRILDYSLPRMSNMRISLAIDQD
jgi:hypothetical protein